MTDPIGGLGRISPGAAPGLQALTAEGEGAAAGGVNFGDVFLKSLEQVNQLDRQAQAGIASGLTGEDLTQAEIFTAVKKADLAFRTMMQIRNKLVDAYNEVKQMRM